MMGSLLLIFDDGERRLPEQDPHYVWMDAGVLKISTNPPSHQACVGHLVSEFGEWWFHSGPAECPPELRINGRPAEDDLALATDRVELRLSAEPYTQPPPRQRRSSSEPVRPPKTQGPPVPPEPAERVRQYVIGPPGSDAHIVVNDLWVVSNHARVEEDPNGAWWVTAINGEVFVDDESVTSTVRPPGSRFRVGSRVLTVPGTRRRGRGLSVECAGLTARRAMRPVIDDVTFTIPAGEFVVVYSPKPVGTQMLLGLMIGAYRADGGAVRVGGSSRKGNPAVRWVPATDDLHGLLTVAQTLSGVETDRQEELLSWVGLTGTIDREVRTLDEAERERLSIALELTANPALLVIFESATSLAVSADRDLIARLANISRDTGCTVVVAARTVENLDLAGTVVVLDDRGRLRHAGPPGGPMANQPGTTRVGWLATLEGQSDERGNGRDEVAVRPPPMRPRPLSVNTFDGLAAMLLRQVQLFRKRSNGVLLGLPLLALLGSAAAAFTPALVVPVGVAVLCALAAGGIDLITERAAYARDRRCGTGAGAIVAARLAVHGIVCAVLALPIATAADIANTALPNVPGLPTWSSLYLLLWLAMLLSLATEMLACAAVRPDDLPPTQAVATGVLVVAGLILGCSLLLSLSGVFCLPGLLVLNTVAGRAATSVLENRLT